MIDWVVQEWRDNIDKGLYDVYRFNDRLRELEEKIRDDPNKSLKWLNLYWRLKLGEQLRRFITVHKIDSRYFTNDQVCVFKKAYQYFNFDCAFTVLRAKYGKKRTEAQILEDWYHAVRHTIRF